MIDYTPLLSLARQAIASRFGLAKLPDKHTYLQSYPYMGEVQATFVTLNRFGRLRGCIGSLIAHRDLFDDVITNAQSAAFHDPRFTPLHPAELSTVTIDISLLTPAIRCPYATIDELRQKIIPLHHGVVLRHDGHQATFLPHVWEQLKTFEMFFAHLGRKAGLDDNVLRLHPEIYLYTVTLIKSEESLSHGC